MQGDATSRFVAAAAQRSIQQLRMRALSLQSIAFLPTRQPLFCNLLRICKFNRSKDKKNVLEICADWILLFEQREPAPSSPALIMS